MSLRTMNETGRFAVLLGLIALVMVPASANAQTGSATSIVGQVKDENGGVLPGVTVTLRGPALQMPEMVTVTDAQGDYRLSPLPIGTFTLQFELGGFQSMRLEGINLTSGFTATLNQVMKIGAVTETITVSGQSPLVDVTQATTATSLQGDSLALLPSGNNGIVGFLQQVPGVRTNIDVGGSSITDTNLFATNGQSGEQWPMLEGVFAATAINSASGTHYDFNAVEEGRFQTSANQVDNPLRGVGINLVMKSGGNAYHGLGEFSDTNYHFQSSNISDALKTQGVKGIPKLFTRRDIGGQIGGKIIQDQLWFFADWRHRKVDNEIPFAVSESGGVVTRPQHQFFQVYKVSDQINKDNRVVLFWHRYGDSDKRGASQFVPESSMVENDSWGETWKAEWQMTRGKWLTFSTQWGHFNQVNSYHGFAHGHPATTDIVTQLVTGDSTQQGSWSWGGQEQGRAAATIYKTDLAGNHVLNVGFNDFIERNFGHQETRDTWGDGDYQIRYNNGAAYQVTVYNYPTRPLTRVNYWALYVQDTWTINHRLTLNPGFRGQRDHGFVPAGCQQPGNNVQAFPTLCTERRDQPALVTYSPRMYVAFDVKGDGKSVIKGGYGRFVHLLDPGGIVSQLNVNGNRNMTFTWHDNNNDKLFQYGEANLDPNGADYVSGGSITRAFINPNLKAPWSDQFSVGFERQLMSQLAARVEYSYDRNFNVQKTFNPLIPWSAYNIPITSPDPGPDGRAGTADDPGTTLTYYDYGPEYHGAQFAGVEVEDPNPKYNNNYKTLEFSMIKRLSNKWQLIGSYSRTKNHNPFPGSGNPNTQINVADYTSSWIGKLSGSYIFPKGILGGFSYSIRSGDRLARQVLLQGGKEVTSMVVNAGLPGSLNLPNIPILDLRATKRFSLQRGQTFEVRLDCFNSFNASPVQSIVVRSGTTFNQATASAGGGQNGTGLTPPRLLQLGAVYSF
jgi:Carboxypeptidase regulatory-like domain/TonB dependent receptor-like, beta-barrel